MDYYQLSDTVRNTVLKVLGHMSAPESVACSCTCILLLLYMKIIYVWCMYI